MIAAALPGDWLGYIAAVLTTAAFVPQALKTLRSRDTRALSLSMYLIFTVGIAFWLAYGLVLGSWPIIFSNSLTLVLAGIILVLKLRHG